jgi:MFS transporter, DHA2 family, methylenomycin A resistance protein
VSPRLATLITARVVQGVGAALLVPTCLALIQATYPDRLTRARAIGNWGTVGGVAGGSGPLLGGVLTEAFGWRALFWVNVPIAVLTLWLTRLYVRAGDPPADDRARRGFDRPGQVTGGIALVGVTAGVVEGGRNGWFTPVPIALIAIGIGAAAAFVAIERRRAEPMVPLSIFDNREMIGATAVGFVMNFSFYGLLFVEAIVLERRYAFSPWVTGLAPLPQTGVIAVGSWFGGIVTGRIGPRVPMMVGMAVGAAGFFGLTVIGPETPYLAIVAPMAAAGFGISFCMPAATSAVVEAAPERRAGIASGVLNASRQIGGALGIALLGSFIAAAHGLGATLSGARMAMIVAGAAYVIGLALAASTVRAPDKPLRPPST